MNNEIYSLSALKKNADSLTAKIRYDATHKVFEGHFPDNPIVPGVCTLNMISDIVRDNVGGNYRIKEASNVKYLQLIRPDHEPMLRLIWKDVEAGLQVNATLEQDGTILMRFAGTFTQQ